MSSPTKDSATTAQQHRNNNAKAQNWRATVRKIRRNKQAANNERQATRNERRAAKDRRFFVSRLFDFNYLFYSSLCSTAIVDVGVAVVFIILCVIVIGLV